MSGGGEAPRSLANGEQVVIRLPENPTTGYRWQFTQSGAGELAVVDDRFVPDGAEGAPGAGGQRLLRLQARRPGATKLEAVLRRQWDPQDAGTQTQVFAFVVK